MIGPIFAVAAVANTLLANSIVAPYGIWARAEWGRARPNIQLTIENQSKVKAWLIDVTCNAYDRRGALVGVATANLAQLQPGERHQTWAVGDPAPQVGEPLALVPARLGHRGEGFHTAHGCSFRRAARSARPYSWRSSSTAGMSSAARCAGKSQAGASSPILE